MLSMYCIRLLIENHIYLEFHRPVESRVLRPVHRAYLALALPSWPIALLFLLFNFL